MNDMSSNYWSRVAACRLPRSGVTALPMKLVGDDPSGSRLIIILYLISSLKLVQRRATMPCSKETAKDTGLNIWVDGDHDGNGPEAE